jgi:hypothetical protein
MLRSSTEPIIDFIILDQDCLDIRRALVIGAAEFGDAPCLVSGEEPGEKTMRCLLILQLIHNLLVAARAQPLPCVVLSEVMIDCLSRYVVLPFSG